MKKIALLGFVCLFSTSYGICRKCVEIREDNAKLVQKYQYYEDYLKAEGLEKNTEPEDAYEIDEE